VRLADFHNARGHGVSLLLPVDAGPLYLRRTSDGREFEIPPTAGALSLAELAPREPRSVARGAAHDAFSLVFSLPFDEASFAAAAEAQATLAARANEVPAPPPLPRWRQAGALVVGGVAAAALVGAGALAISAEALSGDARRAADQRDAATLNDRLSTRTAWARAALGLGAAAAVAGGLFLWLPRSDVYATGAADGETAMLEVGGHF
jgi:hypothetical protein